jgi:methylase of polypeptide subunit release factors
LGAGCGIQAVLAAPHSRRVTATDLNPRAPEFIRFNAQLNGVPGIECLTGDTFAPVAGRQFDLIVANPPFFVTPTHGQLYCENSMELDLYCRGVVREAPGYLTEGGFLQMVFEWVSVRGQPWQDRIREWLEGAGCDAWVLHTYARDAAAYARERIRQTIPAEAELETLTRWMEYYSSHGVEEIHGGILALRRRSGRNWIRVEEMPLAPAEPFGEAIREAFAGFDFLAAHPSEDEMLAARPRLSPDAQLEQQFRQADGKWQPAGMKLALARGIPASMRVEPPVADFLARLDGRHTLGVLVDDLASAAKADPVQVRRECAAIVHKLVERRFVFV